MSELGIVRRNIMRADRALVDPLAQFGVATVHEAYGRLGLMKPYMRPIYPGAQISGTAVTVLLHPGDNWMLHVVAEQIEPGDIVVAAITADCCDGYFGDLIATSFKARGGRGLLSAVVCARREDPYRNRLPGLEQMRLGKGHGESDAWLGQRPGRLRGRSGAARGRCGRR